MVSKRKQPHRGAVRPASTPATTAEADRRKAILQQVSSRFWTEANGRRYGHCSVCGRRREAIGLNISDHKHLGEQCPGAYKHPAEGPPPRSAKKAASTSRRDTGKSPRSTNGAASTPRLASAPPADSEGTCPECHRKKRLRRTDGRVVAHQFRSQKCPGSGRSPVGGRQPKHMVGVTAPPTVYSGGLPGLGRRG